MENDFIAGFAFKGYMNSDLFTGWVEQVFFPTLKNPKKSMLFIDNASHHPKERLYDTANELGFTIKFIPKYSPDLNPIVGCQQREYQKPLNLRVF